MRRILPWAVAAVLMAAAILVRNHQLDAEEAHAPFDMTGTVGERVEGRNIAATVHTVYLTPVVDVRRTGWDESDVYHAHDDGVFVIFDLTTESLVANGSGEADLVAADRTFAEQYVGLVPNHVELTPRVPMRGGVGFEIPAALEHSTVQLRMVGEQDSRMDSRLVIDVDLAAAQRVPILHQQEDGLRG